MNHPPRHRRSHAGLAAAGAVIVLGGVGIGLVEWLGLPKGSVWAVVAATVALAAALRTLVR
ncbi:MAG TPA: hypothetical protein VNO23_01840 [Candidatus Binatia bacterium]|nr:hypothetical protein [Candidatus Binatia bacterium]